MAISVKLVFMDKRLTLFMQHCDVFEKFKVIVRGVVNVEMEPCTEEVIQKLVNKSVDEPYVIIAVIVMSGDESISWVDPSVRAVSNGSQWITMTEYVDWLKAGSNWPNP